MERDGQSVSSDELPAAEVNGTTSGVLSPQVDNRRRTTSVLERLRLRTKSTVEKDSTYQESDFGSIANGQLLGLSISLRIPFTQTGAGKHGTMKVLYVIRCTLAPPENAPSNTPMKTWEVTKRFSEFYKLDKVIKDCLRDSFASAEGAYGLAMLPPRHLLTSDFDEQIISERKQGFVKYLQSALTASFFFEDIQPILASFLECPGASKLAKLNAGSMKSVVGGSSEFDDDAMPPEDKGTALLTQTPHGEAQHGFLHKHAGPSQLFKPFRLVFCVLNFSEGIFRYYRASHPVLLGEMRIKGVYGKVTALEPKQYGIPSSGFGFSIWTPGRELILYAETNEDRLLWMQSFKALLSTVVPSAATALPMKSPRTPFVPTTFSPGSPPSRVDLGDSVMASDQGEVQGGSIASLVFKEESRRLSSALSQGDPMDGMKSPIISRERLGSSSANTNNDGNNAGRHGSVAKERHKASRTNSLLDPVQEGERLQIQDDAALDAMMRQDRQERRESSSTHSLQAFTREALHAASQRRARTASENGVGETNKDRAGSSTDGEARSAAGRLKPRTSSLTLVPPHSSSLSPAAPEDSSHVLLESISLSSPMPPPPDRPRFPSNISIMSDVTVGRNRDDSIRPPSYAPDQSPSRSKNALSKAASSSNRVQQLKNDPDGIAKSPSWRSKLPPPRFPSNLRLASSGGSSAGGASPSYRILTRGLPRTPRPFRLFPPQHTMNSATSTRSMMKDLDVENAGLFEYATFQLKVDSLPTRNPHVLLALMDTPNPWKGRAVHLMTAHQFSACLENVYYDTASLRKSAAFRPRSNDLIVTSVARSGATPVLLALDSLRSGQLVNLEDLPARVPWIEGKELSGEFAEMSTKHALSPVDNTRNTRLLKSTMPVRHCLGIAGGNAISSQSPKVVVVLRDPLDLKLSWFRHCRRVYKKLLAASNKKRKAHGKSSSCPFDDKFSLEDFAQVPMPSCNPTFSAAMAPNETYECYIREVLQIYTSGKHHGRLHIVFYEELLSDCENTIRKLAEFYSGGLAVDEMLIRSIVDGIQDSIDFPSTLNEQTNRLRVGSTGQGCKEFSRHDVEQIDFDWDRIVRSHFPDFEGYANFYEHVLGMTYPHPRVRPFEEDLAKARKSSGLSALALMQPGRRSLKELKVAKFVQKRLTSSQDTTYKTNSDGASRKGKRIDPDDSEEEEE